MNSSNDRTLIIALNMGGVLIAYVLLGASLWLSTDVPLATKGYWAMAVILLTISLINVVKYRLCWFKRGLISRIQIERPCGDVGPFLLSETPT